MFSRRCEKSFTPSCFLRKDVSLRDVYKRQGAAVALLIFLAYVGVNVMPVLILAGLIMGFYFIYSDKAGSVGKLGSVKNKDLVISQVTFDDIGGQESAKRELKEALDFMKEGERVSELGIRPLKGILLTGPPGTGKTLLAKAAATYTDSAFISVSGSAFIEMYAGVGAKRVRDVFARAREEARNGGKSNAIIFIDEIDVLGATRGRNQGHMEYDQTLNQLLIQMDGFSSASDVKVLVMAATNRVDLLDDALLRPGRFDRIVSVDLPDRIARKRILEDVYKRQVINGFGFQPSEVTKVLSVLVSAYFISRLNGLKNDMGVVQVRNVLRSKDAWDIAIIWASVIALMASQRDFGTALVFFLTCLVLGFAGTGNKRVLTVAVVVGLLASVFAVSHFEHIQARFFAWLNPWAEPNGRGYQIIQGFYALASGGLFGKGYGMGRPDLIPASFTDMNFAAIGEELGLFGAVGILLIMFLMVCRLSLIHIF